MRVIPKLIGALIILSTIILIADMTFASAPPPPKLLEGLKEPYPAPSLQNDGQWINSAPLSLESLKGKVVLVDFWAYSCINCIRTFPFLNKWYQDYKDRGFVIIGVHAPEFDFEKDLDNVKKAIGKYNIAYPVVLDNQFTIWKEFKNQVWPAHYLIDKAGNVVYQHFGEGHYEITEHNIVSLLDKGPIVPRKPIVEPNLYLQRFQTPETYLGYLRANNYGGNNKIAQDGPVKYEAPKRLIKHQWAMQGQWTVLGDKTVSQTPESALRLYFVASKVFAVMGSVGHKPIKVKLLLNGKPLTEFAGKDVLDSAVVVSDHRLYELVDLKKSDSAELTLLPEAQGVEFFTFTFGSE